MRKKNERFFLLGGERSLEATRNLKLFKLSIMFIVGREKKENIILNNFQQTNNIQLVQYNILWFFFSSEHSMNCILHHPQQQLLMMIKNPLDLKQQ